MAETILTQDSERVATITLNRPAALNALNPDMAGQLHLALEGFDRRDDIRCIVIAGAGDHFMAGGDVKFFHSSLDAITGQGAEFFEQIFRDVHGAVRLIRNTAKPVLASVRGAAAGFGVSLIAACDLAIAAEDCVFNLAYCHIGASPDGASTYFLPRTIGPKRTMELALLGERFEARQAKEMGLVNDVVPPAQLHEATVQLARRLASGPSFAYANTKALVNASFDSSLDEQLRAEEASFVACARSPDFAEGVAAFQEKRKPRFLR